jgi:Tol biopolymer transport system component/predicted Ser/Thr protein kinase
MIGATLGQYRIEARLGSGGMGIVYRASDERLHRTVAIKVVDASRTGSTPEQRAHLLDEARAASALNHPNICTVYEVGEAEGLAFIAMEHVDGRPLAEAIPHDGLPTEALVRLGVQIADALAHAHDHGVIHRDLKTPNIVINTQGNAKVLDFGLARRVEVRPDEVTRSIDPAGASALAGTLAYLAPEVLLGSEADARSDIWALGVVLFEMAAGGLPFKGLNDFDITAAILRSPPPPFPRHVPPMLRTVILHCLAKEPGQRYRRAGEVRAALEAIQSDPAALMRVAPSDQRVRGISRRALSFVAAAAVIFAAAALAWKGWPDRAPDPWETRAAGAELTRVLSTDGRTLDPVLSPDGRMLCFEMEVGDRMDLFVGRVAGGARIRLTDDDAIEESPRFSPDGERIAFTSRGGAGAPPEIHVVPALGGESVLTIAAAASPAWSADGRRLAYVKRVDGNPAATDLTISSVDGSDPRAILRSDAAYPFTRNPAWSPDGRHIVVIRGHGGASGELWIVSTDGRDLRRMHTEAASIASESPVYTPDGRGIIHSSNRGGATNIWYAPVSGAPPTRLTTGPGPDEAPSVGADGSIAFVNSRWRHTLESHDPESGATRTLATHGSYIWSPAVSPDGKEIAFSRSEENGQWHLWTLSLDDGATRRVTSTEAGEIYPRWAPDGTTLFFHTWGTPRKVRRVARAGGAITTLDLRTGDGDGYADVSPDGSRIAFARAEGSAERIFTAPVAGGDARRLTESPGATPRWSPDGAVIAFGGNRGYVSGIFLADAKGGQARRLTNDGGWPVWWPKGNQIGYLAIGPRGNQEIRVVPAAGGASRVLEKIRLIGTNHPFAVMPDGRVIVSNSIHLSDEVWLLHLLD